MALATYLLARIAYGGSPPSPDTIAAQAKCYEAAFSQGQLLAAQTYLLCQLVS
jgi:hypothetical protein